MNRLQKALCLFLSLSMLFPLIACSKEENNSCTDGECYIPPYDENGNQVYPIVSPVGYHDLEMIEQAPRLDSLSGKTFAIVGGSFMASTTHPVLKQCILEKYPDARVYVLQEVGSGGPYSVFGQSAQTKVFQEKLKELNVDAVISGNCGCGLCTTKESGSAIAAEYIGIPAVTVGAPTFIAQIHSTGVNRGVPVLRTAEYPGAFSSHSESELKKNTREVVFPQIEKALTEAITEDEIRLYANEGKRPYDEIVYYGNYDEIQEYFSVNGWTDGLPVTPPTDAKVREYLKFTPYKAEDILGTFALAYRECTAYTVAVNAVMAGVPAEFMPLCIAFAECMENGEWRRPLASTHGWSPYAFFNGPVARQLGIDHAQGMISEESNKALGRFIELAMLNIGGYYIKENRMGTFGYLTPWTFAEDEEACLAVGWNPYHVTQGYDLNDSTITAASALQWGNNVTPATEDAEKIMTLLAWDITEKQQNGLGNTNPQVYRTVFITSSVAEDLAKKYQSKNALEDALIATARRPLYMRAYANYWANTGSQQSDKYSFEEYYNKLLSDPAELAKVTATPEWMQGITADKTMETIATMRKGQTPLLVTGDRDRNKFQVMPGGGFVSVKIKLPDNWNELLAPLGYEPLENFYLNGASLPAPDEGKVPETPSQKAFLSDGTYRIVPSEQQLTEAGRVLYNGSEFSFWSYGSQEKESIPLPQNDMGKILSALSYNCSFTVQDGRITHITLRPSSMEKKLSGDVSALTSKLLGDIALSFSVTTKQSKEAGGVSLSGSSLTLSSTVTSLSLAIRGQMQMSENSVAGFVSMENGGLKISPAAAVGSTAKINIKASDGRIALAVTKKSDDTIVIAYQKGS